MAVAGRFARAHAPVLAPAHAPRRRPPPPRPVKMVPGNFDTRCISRRSTSFQTILNVQRPAIVLRADRPFLSLSLFLRRSNTLELAFFRGAEHV